MQVFVAGGTGVIGERLVPLLVAAGHEVVASTRSERKLDRLAGLGARPVLLDGLDAMAVGEAVARAEPEVVIHQMTALAGVANLRRFDREFAVTNQLRTAGTDNLLTAALAAGAKRFIVQGFCGWPGARSGGPVKTEEDPLDPSPPAAQRETLAALRYTEDVVPAAWPLAGIVLRFGSLYGPGASDPVCDLVRGRKLPIVGSGRGVWSWLHADDAASATAAAVTEGVPGVYNIADDEPAQVNDWLPYLARELGARPPLRVPAWVGRLAAGEVGVSMMTAIRGASNAKAKRELGWAPRWATWRDGFREAL